MKNTHIKSVKEAQKASQSGQYDLDTLHSFRYHWQQTQSFERWLEYMIFKRQLGYALSPAHLRLAQQWYNTPLLMRWQHRLYGHRFRQLRNLVDEANGVSAHPAVKRPFKDQVMEWRRNEAKNIKLLQRKLHNSAAVVVGNSPNLAEQAQGSKIDNADVVIRFNQYQSDQTKEEDIGKKLDVWVVAPGYQGPIPEHAEFVIVTGPNMLWWQQTWHTLSHHRGKIIGVPLSYWKACVKQLSAPPSAGFLVVQFLKEQNIRRLAVTGFGIKKGSPYHHAIKGHKAVSRHNWSAESNVMNEWIKQHPL